MKKILIAFMIGLALMVPAYAQKVDEKAIADGCLTPEEWAVSMATQGLAPIGIIQMDDGFFQYYQLDSERFILFPFNLEGCGIMELNPVVLTASELKERLGIVVS